MAEYIPGEFYRRELPHLVWGVNNYSFFDGAREVFAFSDQLMDRFLEYISSMPDQKDILFMENLKTFGYPDGDFEIERLESYMKKAREN